MSDAGSESGKETSREKFMQEVTRTIDDTIARRFDSLIAAVKKTYEENLDVGEGEAKDHYHWSPWFFIAGLAVFCVALLATYGLYKKCESAGISKECALLTVPESVTGVEGRIVRGTQQIEVKSVRDTGQLSGLRVQLTFLGFVVALAAYLASVTREIVKKLSEIPARKKERYKLNLAWIVVAEGNLVLLGALSSVRIVTAPIWSTFPIAEMVDLNKFDNFLITYLGVIVVFLASIHIRQWKEAKPWRCKFREQ